MKLDKKKKEIIKSYLRSVAVATVTTALALVADVRPELAILAGAVVAPLIRYLDPKNDQFGVNS
ncbi:hypothetical protein UFOVP701_4 [uncultured Caudovirales phage]|jgi:hypothetical protein|uniref:Uncharacterized protein n=1 Tax=uncultured Caudovirales phage TaxID=2100421 RepID=A0A6J5NMQ4_9CAUD|nr:hypothetical protein UFOVP701_4 [uncultured Caudovirales phage]